ncbi:MAG: hypothetical protein CME60_05555 [Halobacteriovoraceae bacterium]|nr:hypothetical protein [Halobacteriovoraceae bacterium]|tara:strand:+ start:142028 stop:142531 length:504 start_codon:yes stop_codon:yes gene_type:complete
MEKSLLIIERIVVESLFKKSLDFEKLKVQTSLSESLLQAVLGQLIQKGILVFKNYEYELNWEHKSLWLPIVTDKEGAKAEIKELFSSLVNQIYEKEEGAKLKVQKIYLNQREKEELERKLADIDSFIQGVRNQRKVFPVKENISKQQVVFYGHCEYRSLVDEILKVS